VRVMVRAVDPVCKKGSGAGACAKAVEQSSANRNKER
jgi:hypothetical protein